MPLNEKHKQQLRDMGYNPDELDIYEEGEEGSLGRTIGDIAATAGGTLLPAVAGISSGIASSTALTPLGGAAVGIGTGIGTQIAQDAVLSKFETGRKIINRREGARSTSPVLSLAGEIVPELIMMRPGRGIARLLAGRGGKQAQQQAIAQTALGAGVAGGLEGGAQALTEADDTSLTRVAGAAIAGGLLNEPRGFVQKYIGTNLPTADRPVPTQGELFEGSGTPIEQPRKLLNAPNTKELPAPRSVKGEGFEFTPSERQAELRLDDPSNAGDDLPLYPGEVQSAVPPRTTSPDMEELEVVPSPDGEVLQKPAHVVEINREIIKPDQLELALRAGVGGREAGFLDPDDLTGMNDWLKKKDVSLPQSDTPSIVKPLGEESSAEDIMDLASEVYWSSNRSFDDFKNKMELMSGYDSGRIPPQILWKTLKSQDLIDPEKLDPMFHTGLPPLSDETKELVENVGGGLKTMFTSTVDRVDKIPGIGKYLSPKLKATYADERFYHGQAFSDFADEVQKLKRENRIKMATPGEKGQLFMGKNMHRVAQYMSDEYDGGLGSSPIKLTADEQRLLKAAREVFRKVRAMQNDMGLPIIERVTKGGKKTLQAREGKFNETWMPMPLKSSVIDGILETTGAHKSKDVLREEFVTYAMDKLKKSKPDMPEAVAMDEAMDKWHMLENSFKADTQTNMASRFGPLDIPEGIGVPPAWRDLNLMSMVSRYSRRSGKRLSYWKNLEQDPQARVALGINGVKVDPVNGKKSYGRDLWQKQADGSFIKRDAKEVFEEGSKLTLDGGKTIGVSSKRANPDIASIMDDLEGREANYNIWLEGAMGLVKSNVMGFGTGVRDTATMPVIAASFLTPETVFRMGIDGAKAVMKNHVKSYRAAVDSVSKSIAQGMRQGVITRDIGSIDTYIQSGGSDVVEGMFRMRDLFNKISARSQFEQLSRGLNFGIGKYAVMDMGQALADQRRRLFGGQSRKQMEAFFDNFAPRKDWREAYGINKKKFEIPEEDMESMSARFVEATQGTYDQRGLPAWAVNKGLSPLVGLHRWGIERSMNAKKYVINPALRGNYMPAIMTIGAAMGAAPVLMPLYEALRGGRKDESATWKEWYSAEDLENEPTQDLGEGFYRFATVMTTASQLGIAMDVLSNTMQAVQTQKSSGTVDDLLLSYKDDMVKGVTEVFLNVVNGNYEGPMDFLEDMDVLVGSLNQTHRFIQRTFFPKHKERTVELNRKRDLRVFDRLHDYPLSAPISRDLRTRDHLTEAWKEAETGEEIAKTLPKVVDKAIERSTEGRTINPSKLNKHLNKLRTSNTVPVPNIENDPLKASQYMKFLQRTQGSQAVQDLTQDYLIEGARSRIKNSLVPRLGM